MRSRAKAALSGVVVSVLLMAPSLVPSAVAQDAGMPPGTTQHRRSSQPRLLRQRPHRAAVVAPARYAGVQRPPLTAAFVDIGPAVDAGPAGRMGLASWYGGRRWHGKRTSSGAIFDENALTAAHATLPLGSRVRVTLLGSDREVVVTINDRPGSRTRIIDLSREAGRQLGILERGVALVTLTPL